MSEGLEQWRAREKIRSDVGCAAVWVGLWGILGIAGGVLQLTGCGIFTSPASRPEVRILVGIAPLACAVGLWEVRAWARWATAVVIGALPLRSVIHLVRDQLDLGPLLALAFFLFPVVYLLLPSTGRRFARTKRGPARPL